MIMGFYIFSKIIILSVFLSIFFTNKLNASLSGPCLVVLSFFKRYPAFPFYVFLFSVVMFVLVRGLVQQGMFMDGIQYACVSKNLAEGYGSFWFPFLSPFWCQNGAFHFFEHPPLFYWAESCFFHIPGAGAYAEKLFCAVLWLLNAGFIHSLWKLVYVKDYDKKRFGWLPLLLWTITPVCFWCFHNNMIEILVSLFVLSSVYFGLCFLMNEQKKNYHYLVLSAILLYAGFLTKGLVALFPLSMFLVFALTHRKLPLGKAFLYTGIAVVVFAVLFLSVYLISPSANYMLNFYFKERLLSRIEQTPTTSNRFELLFDLVSQLLPVLMIAAGAFLTQLARKRLPGRNEGRSWFRFFLLMGFCGSLPIMLTMVQKGFYFMPSLGFYALAFSALILGFFRSCRLNMQQMSYKVFKGLSLLLAVASVVSVIWSAGKFSRDEALLKEVHELGAQMEHERTINVDMDVYCTWNYQFYLQRYHRVYLDPTKTYRNYLLVNDPAKTGWLYRYRFVRQLGSGFSLYERK